ncbi:hypothetical protein C8Q74DRAFT_568961 [Fomes fomentarius]|nr:hypothetical protein C8Q74DRAFT_568961 [Fomes fomentarius]
MTEVAYFAHPSSTPPGYSSVYQPPVELPQDRPRNNRRRRFWHLLACTFVFITGLHIVFRHNARKWHFMSDVDARDDHATVFDPSQCADTVNWTKHSSNRSHDYPYHAQTSLSLPLSAAELSFIAAGSAHSGQFIVLQDLDEGSEDALADIDVLYHTPDFLDEATVCRTHPAEDAWGLGIFTPYWRHRVRPAKFYVRLHLPVASSVAILKINSLRTHLPNWAHDLPNLADSVYFQRLQLESSNAHINAGTVAGDAIKVHASNGGVRGEFNTSTELVIETSNAPIVVRADLLNGDERPTVLRLKTSNGRIDSAIALASNTSDATKGKYEVTARTSNSALHLTFFEAPVDHSLNLEAHTSNALAEVTLHKTYEGTFDLSSSRYYGPIVQWNKEAEDPKGRGRERRVHFETESRGHVRGDVAWDSEEGEKSGSVNVGTSNAKVHLTL